MYSGVNVDACDRGGGRGRGRLATGSGTKRRITRCASVSDADVVYAESEGGMYIYISRVIRCHKQYAAGVIYGHTSYHVQER